VGARVLVVSARMGAGHDGAARELARRLEDRDVAVTVVDFLDAAPLIGRVLKWIYELWLRRAPWAYEATYRVWVIAPVLVGPLVALLDLTFGRRLRRWAREVEATAIVSTYPLASVVLGRQRRRRFRRLSIPVITYVTDFAVHPLWVDRGVDQHLCVHASTTAAVRELVDRPAMTTGPLVRPAFFAPGDPRAARRALGLPLDAKIALVVAGSWGVGELEETFDELAADDEWLPLVVCGANAALAARLRRRGRGVVLGWTDQMPALMAAADVLVQNAGGLTSMEAFAVGLPVVTYRPIPGHGRDNARQMDRAGVAPLVQRRADLLPTLEQARVAARHQIEAGRALFVADPAEIVARTALGPTPLRPPVVRPGARRVAAAVTGVAVGLATINLAAEAAMAHGIAVTHPSARTSAVFVGVRLDTAVLASPRLTDALADNGITAVIQGTVAARSPAGVRRLVAAGVPVADGGWGPEPRLHLLGASRVVRSTTTLSRDLGRPVRLFVPVGPMTAVDLLEAKLSHERVLGPVVAVRPGGRLPRLEAGRMYVIVTTGADQAAALHTLEQILRAAAREDLPVEPLGAAVPAAHRTTERTAAVHGADRPASAVA